MKLILRFLKPHWKRRSPPPKINATATTPCTPTTAPGRRKSFPLHHPALLVRLRVQYLCRRFLLFQPQPHHHGRCGSTVRQPCICGSELLLYDRRPCARRRAAACGNGSCQPHPRRQRRLDRSRHDGSCGRSHRRRHGDRRGSVVKGNIPAGVLAAGVPCRVLRKITEEDKRRYPTVSG